MEVKVIIEDTKVDERLNNEFGLSMYIEVDGKKILFDTGQSNRAIENAEILGIQYDAIDYLILSHGHHDHIGCLPELVHKRQMNIFASSDIFDRLYVNNPKKGMVYYGIAKELDGLKINYVYDEPLFITPNIVLSKCQKKNGFLPSGNESLFKLVQEAYVKDDFRHEIVLGIKEEDGLVIFTGCSHSGITNMIDTIAEIFPNTEIKGIFGGFHTYNPLTRETEENNVLDHLALKMSSYEHAKIYTGHCTGDEALKYLQGSLYNKIQRFYSGCTIKL